MKKAISLILALVLCLSLCACGSDSTASKNNENTQPPETTQPTEAPVPKEVTAAAFAIEFLKDNLKSPSSLEVWDIRYVEYLGYIFEIDYSAQNGLGGTDRDTIYIHVNSSGQSLYSGYKSMYETNSLTHASIDARSDFSKNKSDAKDLNVDEVMKNVG